MMPYQHFFYIMLHIHITHFLPFIGIFFKKNHTRRKFFVSCVACSTVSQISYSVSFQYASKTDEGIRPVSRTYGARNGSAFSKKKMRAVNWND